MNRYGYKIKREVTYIEDIEAVIVAKNSEEAEEIADGIGNGVDPIWPSIDKINTAHRTALTFDTIELERVE